MGSNVIGIDVGGVKKGFHAALLTDGKTIELFHHKNSLSIRNWVQSKNASIVAIDSPCGWSQNGRSREAERDLKYDNKNIPCFCTPTKKIAKKSSFYDWVFNGEKLYNSLRDINVDICETYPHGITQIILNFKGNGSKSEIRRSAIKKIGLELKAINNLDFVDAVLCSLAAEAKLTNKVVSIGNNKEGYIILPTDDFFKQRSKNINP